MSKTTNYKTLGISISVRINEKFEAIMISNYIREQDIYKARLYISKDEIEMLDIIDDSIEFKANPKKVKDTMYFYIKDKNKSNFFNKYIERYDYQIDCMEKGIELSE